MRGLLRIAAGIMITLSFWMALVPKWHIYAAIGCIGGMLIYFLTHRQD